MQLLIEGKQAVIKKGFSFEYVTENRLFSDADAYSLEISLPLRGCSQNLEIFGRIDRMDANSHSATLNAELRYNNIVKHGVIVVVSASDSELKVQFLEGKSASNYAPDLDKTYINDLLLGGLTGLSSGVPVLPLTLDDGANCVAFMWSNGASDWYDNNVSLGSGSAASRSWRDSTLSFMPYLIYIAKRICLALGFSADFSPWEQSEDKYLVVCNTLPAVWGVTELARALPHWTVNEFFAELEKLLFCEFYFDLNDKTVSMTFLSTLRRQQQTITLSNVVDAYSCDVSDDPAVTPRSAKTIKYAERGSSEEDPEWARDECSWIFSTADIKITQLSRAEFDAFIHDSTFGFGGALINYGPLSDSERGNGGQSYSDAANRFPDVYYIVDEDAFFVVKVVKVATSNYPNYPADPYGRTHVWTPQAVNVNSFGGWVNSDPDADDVEVKCLPARIATFDGQPRLCLTPSAFGETDQSKIDFLQPIPYRLMGAGTPKDNAEYYDKIYLAYWGAAERDYCASRACAPFPSVDSRLNLYSRHLNAFGYSAISASQSLKVSFISDNIPDVRAIFNIRGKRFLCEKITATFTEAGMSQLLKGEFFPIDENYHNPLDPEYEDD